MDCRLMREVLMKVLITGGSGFIGSHIVDRLKMRNIDVRVFDMVLPSRQDVEFYKGSLLNEEEVRMAMNSIDVVYHLAAVANVDHVFKVPHYAEAINTRGTINVLEAMRRTGIKKIIYGSTIWVYSDTVTEIIDETAPLHPPKHLYTATKIASEYYCQSYAQLYGLKATILRYGIPYGPRARGETVVALFVGKALRGEPITIAGDGLQFRKFLYVEDLAEGNVLAINSIADNKIYNLEGKEKVSIRQIVETIEKILGSVKVQYIEGRKGDFPGKEISAKKAFDELGWEPHVSFEEGMSRYIEWYKSNPPRRQEQIIIEPISTSSVQRSADSVQ